MFHAVANYLKTRVGSLKSAHWLVLLLSAGLTIGAWYIAAQQLDARIELQFQREADRVVAQVVERMEKYEDALWSGVAAIGMQTEDVNRKSWRQFSETLDLTHRYPGIMGIGVIHRVTAPERANYLARMRELDPMFRIHPAHGESEYWPISYIEPVAENKRAVGLDMAHETNRFTAAKKARDTKRAQITGPIALVQDAEKTPGFLFFVPYYREGEQVSTNASADDFIGLVYAPFIVRSLMEGTLQKDQRQVGLRITDADSVLYNEYSDTEEDYDSSPLHSKLYSVDLYGRSWEFDVRSSLSFRQSVVSRQPLLILLAGVLIDSLLFALFVTLSRSNQRALAIADEKTEELMQREVSLLQYSAELERSNRDLDDFAHISSHDLREPLRGVSHHARFLVEDHADELSDEAKRKLGRITYLVQHMDALIKGLLEYSTFSNKALEVADTNVNDVVNGAIESYLALDDDSIDIQLVDSLPNVQCDKTAIKHVYINLISNGLKYNDSEIKKLRIGVQQPLNNDLPVFYVKDNGIGIKPEYQEQIFGIFKRLHNRDEYGDGTGCGLSFVAKIVGRHGGKVWLESALGEGSTFFFTLPDH